MNYRGELSVEGKDIKINERYGIHINETGNNLEATGNNILEVLGLFNSNKYYGTIENLN